MQKFIMKVVVALLVLFGASFYVYKTNNVSETYENKENKNVSNMLSMMLEKSAGSGEYQKTSASAWPTEGYVFNETLSKCEKGSSLSWDSTKKTVVMKGNFSDKCYVYFDVYVPPTINEVCSNGDTMSNCIKKLYTKQGENNLYLHDSSLTNGVGDNSYRYAGSSDTTNNFVCFGYDSTDGTCPTDYLYRIIGVFDNEVKLIKYDYAKATLLGTDGDYSNTYSGSGSSGTNKGSNTTTEIGVYYWNNNTSDNTWSESRLNTINLNQNYINKIDENGTKWSEKISDHTWKVGGNTSSKIYNVIVPNTYTNEITSPAENTTYDAQVGLMYVSDYGYAAAPSAWTTTLFNYDGSSVKSVNWMYMGLYEWTIARRTDNSNDAFFVHRGGYVFHYNVPYNYAIRPVFYLTADTLYKSGDGSISSPIIINL